MPLPHKSSFHKDDIKLPDKKALIITTSQSTLDRLDKEGKKLKTGKSTGVYASELTEPYYTFLDAEMDVDVASIAGGSIPIEKLSLMPLVRTKYDNRFLKDENLKQKVERSIPIANINPDDYDIIFLAGGWGAAYDLSQSAELARKISSAYASKVVIGAVCHGPLGLVNALKPDGSPLLKGVKATGVTNRQIKQLFVGGTPKHPETELRNANAVYSSKQGLIDMFQNHVVIDSEHRIVTGQNQKAGAEAAYEAMKLLKAELQG